MEKKTAFHKMRVTGPQCAELITQPLQAMRELNPTLNAILQSTEQMNKVVCEAAKKPLKKRRKIASSAVAVHDAHLQRVKALKSDVEHTSDPLARSLASLPPMPQDAAPIAAPQSPAPAQAEEEEDVSSLSSRTQIQRIVDLVPQRSRIKASMLGKFLKPYPDLIRVTASGRPIVGGKEIPGANILDIIRSLYTWRKGAPLPRGATDVIQALQSVGVPSGLFSASAAQAEYRRLMEPPAEVHSEEEGEGVGQAFETPAASLKPPVPPPQKVVEHPPASSALAEVTAPKATTTARASPSFIPRVKHTSSGIPPPPPAVKHGTSKTSTQTGQGNSGHSNSGRGNSGRGNSSRGNSGRGNSGHGYSEPRWRGAPLWPGFGQPKTRKPSTAGTPKRLLRLY
jgi:hypothetical protein